MQIETQEHLDSLISSIKMSTYVCFVCKEMIFPTVQYQNNNTEILISSESCYARGGKGNKIMSNKMCECCYKKMMGEASRYAEARIGGWYK